MNQPEFNHNIFYTIPTCVDHDKFTGLVQVIRDDDKLRNMFLRIEKLPINSRLEAINKIKNQGYNQKYELKLK